MLQLLRFRSYLTSDCFIVERVSGNQKMDLVLFAILRAIASNQQAGGVKLETDI
jgi:hypothetical protein